MSNFETCNADELQSVEGGSLSLVVTILKVSKAISDATGGGIGMKVLEMATKSTK